MTTGVPVSTAEISVSLSQLKAAVEPGRSEALHCRGEVVVDSSVVLVCAKVERERETEEAGSGLTSAVGCAVAGTKTMDAPPDVPTDAPPDVPTDAPPDAPTEPISFTLSQPHDPSKRSSSSASKSSSLVELGRYFAPSELTPEDTTSLYGLNTGCNIFGLDISKEAEPLSVLVEELPTTPSVFSTAFCAFTAYLSLPTDSYLSLPNDSSATEKERSAGNSGLFSSAPNASGVCTAVRTG